MFSYLRYLLNGNNYKVFDTFNSESDDEIVECDNCGVAVHEGCYGISDNQSIASTESSASTEPWFCDACKAGVKPVNWFSSLYWFSYWNHDIVMVTVKCLNHKLTTVQGS